MPDIPTGPDPARPPRGPARDPEAALPFPLRARVFALTWIAYASYYLARKNFSVVKKRLEREYELTETQLGDIDTGYLVAYTAGQFLAGLAGDRVGARRLIGFGMLLSAAACAAFGAGASMAVFAIAFAVNGIFQATGWPGTVKAMAAWFGPRERGTVMGVWTTNYQAGGLVATAVATFLLAHVGWRAAFYGPAVWVAAVGLCVLLFLPVRAGPVAAAAPSVPAVRSRDILKMPVVWRIGIAYFGLKLIRYSILFWLPYYLTTVLGYTEESAGYMSISFEVGGIAGAVGVGLMSDRVFPGRRREVASTMIALLGVALVVYRQVGALGPGANFAAMAAVGFCLFGPDALISGAAAQDLGGKEAAATAAGAINGLGSLGAILQGRVTSGIAVTHGWDALFLVYAGVALAAAVILRLGRRAPDPVTP